MTEQDKKKIVDEIFEGYWLWTQTLDPVECREVLIAIAGEAVSLASHNADMDWKIADEEGMSYDEWHGDADNE